MNQAHDGTKSINFSQRNKGLSLLACGSPSELKEMLAAAEVQRHRKMRTVLCYHFSSAIGFDFILFPLASDQADFAKEFSIILWQTHQDNPAT